MYKPPEPVQKISFMPDANDPGISRDKQIKHVDQTEIKQYTFDKMPQQMPSNMQPMLNLQLYQPKPKPKPPQPVYPFMGTGMGMGMGMGTGYPMGPIINEYKISYNPFDAGNNIIIYEDKLPEISNPGVCIEDRLELFYYIKSLLFKDGDGRDINLHIKSQNSLLNHLKMIEVNPYKQKEARNMYSGLPEGFLIYRSCYPINYDKECADIICSKKSTSVNIRMYKLSDEIFNRLKNASFSDDSSYYQIREIYYYEYVRDKILKLKMSPNFAMMYGYYITTKTKIDYKVTSDVNYSSYNDELKKRTRPIVDPRTFQIVGYMDPERISEKNIIMLTESPTYTLLKWASTVYNYNGNVRRIERTGSHSPKIWYSILFQIMAGLYAMYKADISIENMSMGNNIFIREVQYSMPSQNIWKYIIDNIDYYIPNYGYVVVIDSHYKIAHGANPDNIIIGRSLGTSENAMRQSLFNNALSILNTNNFGQKFIQEGGCALNPYVTQKISEINRSLGEDRGNPDILFSDIIRNHLDMFIHNRIGTKVKDTEMANTSQLTSSDVKAGTIVIHKIREFSRFALYLAFDRGTHQLYGKDEDDGKLKLLPDTGINILNYNGSLDQDIKINEPNYLNVIETYNM